jgi:hypothetical protein
MLHAATGSVQTTVLHTSLRATARSHAEASRLPLRIYSCTSILPSGVDSQVLRYSLVLHAGTPLTGHFVEANASFLAVTGSKYTAVDGSGATRSVDMP